MSGHILPVIGTAYQWQAEAYPANAPVRRGLSARRVLVLCLGLPLTAGAVAAACTLLNPAMVVQTRIVADGAGAAGRAALAEAALRLQAAPDQSVLLQDQGNALLVSVTGEDEASVRQRARSVADTVLDMPQAGRPDLIVASVAPSPPRQDSPAAADRAASAERSRLQAALDTIDNRLAAVSASLTGVTRDLAASAHAAAERKPVRESLDKAAATLADLQLQRIQLQTRYQDDYPAVVALDGQIRSLRTYLQDETRRVDAAARPPDPADPVLGSERDRLRAELAQLTERRTASVAELASFARMPAATPPDRRAAEAASAARPGPAPHPVLLESATTLAAGPDYRWAAAPALTAVGLSLALIGWFKPGRRYAPVPAELLLQRLEALLMPHGAAGPGLGAPSYPALAHPGPALTVPAGYGHSADQG